MDFRSRSWTYLGVTTLTLLIWFWAASESREARSLSAQVRFTTGDAGGTWIVEPVEQAVRLRIEGSKWSLQKAEAALRSPLFVPVVPEVKSRAMDLALALQVNDALLETGVSVLACEPAVIEVAVDRRERLEAPIRTDIAGVHTVGEIEVDPPRAVLVVPSLARSRLPAEAFVQAVIEPQQLRDLAPSVRHTLTASLRLPEGLGINGAVIEPMTARVSFTIRSRIEEIVLDTVRVQIAGPHQDYDDYVIELEDTLRSVRVWGEGELIRRIASGDVKVIGLLHLTSAEKERLIESKPLTCFLAIPPEGSVQIVNASVGASAQMPVVSLKISKRNTAAGPVESEP